MRVSRALVKKIAIASLIAILAALAILSGASKVALMPQDVEFFGRYGIAGIGLMGFGALQLMGGVGLLLAKTRFASAAVIAVTFIASLVLLILDGNVPVTIVTALATALLVFVMKISRAAKEAR